LLSGEVPADGAPGRREYLEAVFLAGYDGERAAWGRHRGELLPGWIAEHPGTRPAAWWLYDAPEARRQVAGPPAEFAEAAERWRCDGLPWLLEEPAEGARFESGAAYLRRLGLLERGEAERITRGAFRPVEMTAFEDPEAA
jgi:hypothetical protein